MVVEVETVAVHPGCPFQPPSIEEKKEVKKEKIETVELSTTAKARAKAKKKAVDQPDAMHDEEEAATPAPTGDGAAAGDSAEKKEDAAPVEGTWRTSR